jgi:hypothetical protein
VPGKFVIGEFGAHQLTDASRLIVEAERRQNPYLAAKRGKPGIDRESKAYRLLAARITEPQGPLQIFQCLAVLSHCDLHHGKHAVTQGTIIRFVLPLSGFHELARQLERGLQSR